jgi:hypothetical protein
MLIENDYLQFCSHLGRLSFPYPSFCLEVVFCKVDVDENPDTAAKYSVSAMPTFVFISKGVVVDRLMGVSAFGNENMSLDGFLSLWIECM